MKVLFDHGQPFFLAHGGFQSQIEQTKRGLEKMGVEVEWLRWWDADQKGDVLHYWGAARSGYLAQFRRIGCPAVMTSLLSETCNRPDLRLRVQGALVRAFLTAPGGEGIKQQLNWRSFQSCDRNVVGLAAERRVIEIVYGVPPERIAVVPLGLPDLFLNAVAATREGPHLVCVGTITEQKNCIPLAELARRAEVPVLFVGKPYSEADPYWKRFVAHIDGRWVSYQPHVRSEADMVALLQRARGAVIMSRFENWCFAAHEAAACGLPLLLPDQKWSRERFGAEASYFTGQAEPDIAVLRQFHAACAELPAPRIRLYSWDEVAGQLHAVYQSLLAGSACTPERTSVRP